MTLLADDSVTALQAYYGESIDLLYLDSEEFKWMDVPATEFNPRPTQEHALREVKAALPLLHSQSMIVLDDCDLPFGGKCKLVVDLLRGRGWRVLRSAYQVVLVRRGYKGGKAKARQ